MNFILLKSSALKKPVPDFLFSDTYFVNYIHVRTQKIKCNFQN
ncbi:hypothetical protein HMPREF9442_01685 [Paraprevotella xylaniphila YIT 11841]|uniref:Uncharacterized protein n=1 Tax=Paraprevotella xylaniphila YIT 11841 TaxID=762982 RepID=F3QU16_9BACT|nr:hypothetical protein HMPREF9442_01685 [Paraprevotella xylaniphila YIT 11841]